MNSHNIGLDIDGVLADFRTAWLEYYPDLPPQPGVYHFDDKIMQRFTDMREADVLNDFFLKLKPLLKPEDIPFEPKCYVTARPVPTEISEQWLAMHGFPKKKVITVPLRSTKVEVMENAGIEIFIDDLYDNFKDLNDAGILTYLFSAPWNIKYDVGDMRLNSLSELPLLQD